MKKILLLITALALGLVILGACGRDDDAPAGAGVGGNPPVGEWPLVNAPTITWWQGIAGNVAPNYTTRTDTPHHQFLVEATGINIEWIHPPQGQGDEIFQLMVATRDFPDIIEANWLTIYHGGPERAIEDDVILRLNDVFASYAPHVLRFLETERPDLGRAARTDLGSYFVFPFVRGHFANQVFTGPFVRSDWMDELGLSDPETVDDWEYMLTRFRDDKGATAPFTYQWGQRWLCPIAAAYQIRIGNNFFVHEDGTVRFGFAEPAFRDYITRMNRWFREGLLDPDYGTALGGDIFNARVTGDHSGAAMGNIGGAIGVFMNAMADHPTFDLRPISVPVLNPGDPVRFGHADNPFPGSHSVAITSGARDRGVVEYAARLLDFGYSPQGYLLMNFGVEGDTYTMVNGVPTYTERVTNDPRGIPLAQSIASVARASYGGPFPQSYHYVWQFFALQRQRDALAMWMQADSERFMLPPITFTPEEFDRVALILPDLYSTAEEWHLGFLYGTIEINDANFQQFNNILDQLGLQEVLQHHNAAVQRFRNR